MLSALTSLKLYLFRLIGKLYTCFKLYKILSLVAIIQLLFNYSALDTDFSIILTSKHEL